MPGWDTIQSYGPANGNLDAQQVEAIRQQLAKPQPLSSVWIPVEPTTVVSTGGLTTAVAETTVPLSPSVIVPQGAAAVTYYLETLVTGGTGYSFLWTYHKPGGGPITITTANSVDAGYGLGTALLDINGGRLTYKTTISGSPTYSILVRITGFLRAGALL